MPVLQLEGGETGDVVSHPHGGRGETGYCAEDYVGLGNMDVLEAIVRFPEFSIPRQAIGGLNVEGLAIRSPETLDRLVLDVGELRNEFGRLLLPDHVAGLNPFA